MYFKTTSFFQFHEHPLADMPKNVIFTKMVKFQKIFFEIQNFFFEKTSLALGYIMGHLAPKEILHTGHMVQISKQQNFPLFEAC